MRNKINLNAFEKAVANVANEFGVNNVVANADKFSVTITSDELFDVDAFTDCLSTDLGRSVKADYIETNENGKDVYEIKLELSEEIVEDIINNEFEVLYHTIDTPTVMAVLDDGSENSDELKNEIENVLSEYGFTSDRVFVNKINKMRLFHFYEVEIFVIS